MQTPSDPTPAHVTLPLVEQVQARRADLQRAHADPATSASTRTDIEAALAALTTMLTGDLDAIPDAVKRDLSKWLETNKYVAASAAETAPAAATPGPTSTPSSAQEPAVTTQAAAAGTAQPAADEPPAASTGPADTARGD